MSDMHDQLTMVFALRSIDYHYMDTLQPGLVCGQLPSWLRFMHRYCSEVRWSMVSGRLMS